MTDDPRPEPDEPEPIRPEMAGPADDAIEADKATESAALDTFEQAAGHAPVKNQGEDEDAVEAEAGPPVKPERLQKILAQAGIASRRHAEEMIAQGRVQVNGAVVTALGTKADPNRDHIRVDGKLLRGAERIRYFVLNKPKGFVTTVSDPEGRPTVMQFFEKMRERLYPVGRLDYLSEGLLLVTNDGELANKLTRAAAGVEKTYLVKVSGQPSEDDLDRLRAGVAIDRERPGSGQVQTAPARIRLMRQGDNPWYEVVLTEGRNRELRKIFEEIGHHVEKIRRVGYGPLVLDLEPGKMRELDSEEVEDLRKAAEGKLRPKRPKEVRRAKPMEPRLPDAGPRRGRVERGGRGFERASSSRAGEFQPKKRFGGERQDRPARGESGGVRSGWKKDARGDRRPTRFAPGQRRGPEREDRADAEPRRSAADRGEQRFGAGGRSGVGKSFGGERRPHGGGAGERGRSPAGRAGFDRPGEGQSRPDRPRGDWSRAERPRFGEHSGNRPRSDSSRPGPRGESSSRSPENAVSWKPKTRFGERGGSRPRSDSSRPGPRGGSSSRSPENAGSWKPKTRFGSAERTASGGRPERGSRSSFGSASGPRPGKAGFGGAKPGGPRRGDAGHGRDSARPKFGRTSGRSGPGGGRRSGGGSGPKGRG